MEKLLAELAEIEAESNDVEQPNDPMDDVVQDSEEKLKAAIEEKLFDTIEPSMFRPLSKEAFLCQAKCCDLTGSREDMNRCIEACAAPVDQVRQYAFQQAQTFFLEHFERCVETCRKEAQDRRSGDGDGGGDGIDVEERNCIQLCPGKELKNLPKFINNVKDYVQQLRPRTPP